MLEVRRLTKGYTGVTAVDDVSFAALAGEVTGYLGPNGSGKSTTVKIITGLLESTDGDVLYKGRPIRDHLIFVVTNQSKIKRGRFTMEQIEKAV